MKILSLHIDGFGKLNDRDLSFKDGLNVVYGRNEAGKSTLHTFIRGMLFGIERQRGRASKMTSTPVSSHGPKAAYTKAGFAWKAREKSFGSRDGFTGEIKALQL